MSDKRNSVDELLKSISDGSLVDWQSIARDAKPEDRARVDALHELSRIAAFSRSLQRGGEPFVARSAGNMTEPERWGDLLLLERLGAGANADIYRAWDIRLQREVALKLLRPDAPGVASGDADAALLNEGRAAARIRHPNVVAIHGIDSHDGRVGLWMDLVRGATLEQVIAAEGPLCVDAAIRVGADIGSALAAVHGAGLLHRDVKPANIVRDEHGGYVLTDFGLGCATVASSLASAPSGTPMYMAPELFAGAAASERSDLYALALTLWFALAGRHPFDAGTLAELIARSGAGTAPLRQIRPEIPEEIAAAIDGAAARRPEERDASAARFARAFESCAALSSAPASSPGVPPTRARAPRSLRGALFAALIVILAVTVAVSLRGNRDGSAADRVQIANRAEIAPTAPAAPAYDVEASFLKRDQGAIARLISGDRVRPGDRLSLEVRATRAVWVYVLNEDERGEHYLLFPQPRFDAKNPIPADRTLVLPGAIDGLENAWTVTSAGGREHFLIVVSPEPLAEIEADLGRLPAADPGRAIEYAQVGPNTVEVLRGVGGVSPQPNDAARPAERSGAFDRFRALAGRETGVSGVWMRQVVLENPRL
ncbi:MAG: protein kinase domain-containing protein [bacterium]